MLKRLEGITDSQGLKPGAFSLSLSSLVSLSLSLSLSLSEQEEEEEEEENSYGSNCAQLCTAAPPPHHGDSAIHEDGRH
jgi:hypothetical protein